MSRKFYRSPYYHPYELFLRLKGIRHRKTKVSNSFIARLHRPLLDGHCPDEPVEQIHTGLDSYLEHYNKTNSGLVRA